MKISYALAITAALALNPLFASATECLAPGTKTADFDNNKVVNGKDVSMLAKKVGKKGGYSGRFDLVSDGVLDVLDVNAANKSRGPIVFCETDSGSGWGGF